MFEGITQSAVKKVYDAIINILSEENSLFDLRTGEFKIDLQKEYQKAKEAALSKIQGIIEFPKADDVFIKNRLQASKSFLSYDLARKILESMDENIDILNGISGQEESLTGAYKRDSIEFCYNLKGKLNEYLKYFSVFYGSTRRSTGRDKMDYFKMSDIKSQMNNALDDMSKLVESYKGKKYSCKGVKDALDKSSEALKQKCEESKEEAAEKLAEQIFDEAVTYLNGFTGEKSSKDGAKQLRNVLLRNSAEIDSSSDLSEEAKKEIKKAQSFTRGIEIIDLPDKKVGIKAVGSLDAKKRLQGWSECMKEAEKQVEPLFRFNDWTKKLKVESPLMGDYADEIGESLRHTDTDIDNALNLKDKKIDVKTLLGSETYAQNSKKLDKQEKYLEKAIDEDFYKKRDLVHSKIEKEYSSIKKYRDKKFGTTESEYDNDFKKLIVNGYNIAEEYEKLDHKYDELLKTQDPNKTEEFITEGYEFLEKCKARGKEQIEYEKKEKQAKKDNEKTAARMIKKDKAHYQELCKQLKQLQIDKKILKEELKIVNKKYDELKWYGFTYAKNFDKNLEASKAFQKLHVTANGELMRDGQEVT